MNPRVIPVTHNILFSVSASLFFLRGGGKITSVSKTKRRLPDPTRDSSPKHGGSLRNPTLGDEPNPPFLAQERDLNHTRFT